MSDLLEHIATHEEAIARQWSRALRNLPRSPYAQMKDAPLNDAVRRSCQALLHVMQTGDTDDLQTTLQQSAQRRAAEGIRYADNMAAWLLYRQVVQEVLTEQLDDEDAWDQLVDRVDAVLDWVMRVVYDAYEQIGLTD